MLNFFQGQPILGKSYIYIETNRLICFDNKLAGFYMNAKMP